MKKKKLQYVVVRTYSAGVHVGELVSRKGREVELSNARRVWQWFGANTLHEVALNGISAQSKVSEPTPRIVLTEAIEVIDCSVAGEKSLRGALWSK